MINHPVTNRRNVPLGQPLSALSANITARIIDEMNQQGLPYERTFTGSYGRPYVIRVTRTGKGWGREVRGYVVGPRINDRELVCVRYVPPGQSDSARDKMFRRAVERTVLDVRSEIGKQAREEVKAELNALLGP